MRQRFILTAMLLGLGACGKKDTGTDGELCEGTTACETSLSCAPGLVCTDGCCEPSETCTADSCGAGTFCDPDSGECTDIETQCALSGCDCYFVNAAGALNWDDTVPQHRIGAGGELQLQAVLVVSDGLPLPNPAFTFTSDNDGVAAVDSTTGLVTAGATAGTATITAAGGANVDPCTVEVVNLGAPGANETRFFVFDEQTGAPLEDATVIVQNEDDNGVLVEAGAGTTRLPTDSDGLASFEDLATPFNVTVVLNGYNHLSVVGLSGNDVTLPLSPRPEDPDVGGFSGRVDFADFERRFLGGEPRLLKAAINAASFPLRAILNFDFSVFVGDIADAADCEDATASNPVAGCYEVTIGSLLGPLMVPLPGGVSLFAADLEIKKHFDSVAFPGRRYAWGMGGEIGFNDLNNIISQVAPYFSCTCDDTNACDPAGSSPTADPNHADFIPCACDIDCGLNIEFGSMLDDIVPLLGEFAMGNRGNLALEGVQKSTVWDPYIAQPYDNRDPDDRFPKLDGQQRFRLLEGMRVFTDYKAPLLPNDPHGPYDMEAMVMLTGVNAPGFGFVPLGLGLGIDCTSENCLDRENHPDDFNRKVSGGVVCKADPNPALDRCGGTGFPASGTIDEGHIGLFRAHASGGLEASPWLTVGIAAPVTGFLAPGGTEVIRGTAFVRHEQPKGAPTDISSTTYPGFPDVLPANLNDRVYAAGAHADANVHWVVLAADGAGAVSTRWNLYLPAGNQSFKAPDLPGGAEDPLTAASVSITHVGFRLGSGQLEGFAGNNGTTLNDLVNNLSGFSVQSLYYTP